MAEHIKKCVACSKKFTTNMAHQICCSEECARERHNTLMKERYNQSCTAKKQDKAVYTKQCIICGKLFQTEIKQKMMCSKECQAERDRIMQRDYRRKERKEKHKKRRKTGISELALVERLAREHGLTYGKYVGLYEYR